MWDFFLQVLEEDLSDTELKVGGSEGGGVCEGMRGGRGRGAEGGRV